MPVFVAAALNDEVVVLESEMTTFSQKCREVEKFQEAQLQVCEVWVSLTPHCFAVLRCLLAAAFLLSAFGLSDCFAPPPTADAMDVAITAG